MPSFTIEAAGEAQPLTVNELYRVLLSASSSDPHRIQTGTKQLQNWESLNGFYSGLQSVYLDTSLPVEVRYLAIIQLKNAVDKYWRKSAHRTLAKNEKDLIRSRVVDGVLNEPVEKLALQSAIFTAKILRSELPKEWILAIDGILQQISALAKQSPTSFQLSRLVLLILYIVKELATARLRTAQTSLKQISKPLADAISAVYDSLSDKWLTFLQFGGDDEGGAIESMGTSLLALRTLRRLLIVGFENPHRNPTVIELWPKFIAQLGRMLKLVSPTSDFTLELQSGPKLLVEKHLMQIAKLHLCMAKDHPAAFVNLPQSIELTKSYWGFIRQFGETYGKKQSKNLHIGTDGDMDDEDTIPFSEQFSLKGLLMIRACAKMVYSPAHSFRYQTQEDKDDKKRAETMIKEQLLSVDGARDIMETIVAKFFVFTPRDMKQWEEEPDEWEKTQEGMGDDWEFSTRVCAEKLFLDVILNHKEQMIPYLINIIMSASQSMANDVWLKDSIYAAIGLAAPVLYERFDFADFLKNTLVQEVQIQKPDYNIIRRRVAIVLGQWLPVKEGLDRPLVYEIFRHLLDKHDSLNDEVVRVTAGRKLGDVVDPFEFDPQGFAPFAPGVIQRLLELVHEVQLPETKLALMNTLHIIVVKMEDSVSPFGDQILNLLPPLWDGAEEDYLIKEMILSILAGLVISMKEESQIFHPSLVPLVASSTSTEKPDQIYLAEEALNLWSAILDQTSDPAPQAIIQLFNNLIPMLEVVSEMLDRALSILDSYILLIPADITGNSNIIFEKFVGILGGARREPIGLITNSIDILFCEALKLGSTAAVEQLVGSLISTKFLSSVISSLRDAWEAHQTSGPNQRYPAIDGVVETDYFAILARLTIPSPALLFSALEATTSEGSPIRDPGWLVDEWFAHIDTISHPERKKLACLALTALLETAHPVILGRLQLLMTMWTSVLVELENEGKDCLVWIRQGNGSDTQAGNGMEAEAGGEARESPGAKRSRQLSESDPVHTVETRDFVREKLGVAVQKVGGMDLFRERWVADVDADVVKAFGELGVF